MAVAVLVPSASLLLAGVVGQVQVGVRWGALQALMGSTSGLL